MWRWPSSLLALAACNQVFGSASVHGADAPFYDAGVDAQPSCPAVAAPAFSRDFFQLAVADCTSVSVAGTEMMALCGQAVSFGTVSGDLTSVPELSLFDVYTVRLSHDGQRATVLGGVMGGASYTVALFHRSGATWLRDPDLATAVAVHAASEISEDGHVLLAYDDGVHELEEQAGAWIDVATHSIAWSHYLGQGVHLSGDALHGWFGDNSSELYYFDRPALGSPFTIAGVFTNSQGIDDAALTDDCGLLYFGALGRIWVAHPAP